MWNKKDQPEFQDQDQFSTMITSNNRNQKNIFKQIVSNT